MGALDNRSFLYEPEQAEDANRAFLNEPESVKANRAFLNEPVPEDITPASAAALIPGLPVATDLVQNAPENVAKGVSAGIHSLAQSGAEVLNRGRASTKYAPQNYMDPQQLEELYARPPKTAYDDQAGRPASMADWLKQLTPEQRAQREADMFADKDYQITQEAGRMSGRAAQADRESTNWVAGLAEAATTMVPVMAAGFATGVATGGSTVLPTIASLSTMAAHVYGQAIAQGRDELHLPEGAATDRAALYTLSETLPELVPLHFVFKAGEPAMKRLLKVGFTEAPSEMVTEVLQIGIDEGLVDPDNDTLQDALKVMASPEGLRRIGEAGAMGFGLGILMGAPGVMVDSARSRIPAEQAAPTLAPEQPPPATAKAMKEQAIANITKPINPVMNAPTVDAAIEEATAQIQGDLDRQHVETMASVTNQLATAPEDSIQGATNAIAAAEANAAPAGAVEPESLPLAEPSAGVAPIEPGQVDLAPAPISPALTPEEIDRRAHAAATSPQNELPEPTEAQKEAGNYKKGEPIYVHGMKIVIENPEGSTRSGKSADGTEWSNTMGAHYGDIKRTEGADGDGVDVFVGKKLDAPNAYVIDQIDQKTGEFDEHKVMLGFDSQEEAQAAYLASYDKGWKVGPTTQVPIAQLKEWIKGDTTQPFAASTVAEKMDTGVEAPPVAAPKQELAAAPAKRELGKVVGATQEHKQPYLKKRDDFHDRDHTVVYSDREVALVHSPGFDKPDFNDPKQYLVKAAGFGKLPSGATTSKELRWILSDSKKAVKYRRDHLSPDAISRLRTLAKNIPTKGQALYGHELPRKEPTPEEKLLFKRQTEGDVRLKRDVFRGALKNMASELEPGGGVTYTKNERGEIAGRTASSNPPWFQSLNANKDTTMSVADLQRAVDKALVGARLGIREQRVVSAMLDEYSGIRTDPPNMDFVREQLARKRAMRGGRNVPIEAYENLGEQHEEVEYPAAADFEGRTAFDLAQELDALGGNADAIIQSAPTIEEAIDALEDEIDERRAARAPEEAAPAEPAAEARPAEAQAPAPQTDLAGEVRPGQQAAADEARRRDQKRNSGDTDMSGTLFGADRGQVDLLDVPGVDVRKEPPANVSAFPSQNISGQRGELPTGPGPFAIETWTEGDGWQDSGEGPFDTVEAAQQYAGAEVGAAYRIVAKPPAGPPAGLNVPIATKQEKGPPQYRGQGPFGNAPAHEREAVKKRDPVEFSYRHIQDTLEKFDVGALAGVRNRKWLYSKFYETAGLPAFTSEKSFAKALQQLIEDKIVSGPNGTQRQYSLQRGVQRPDQRDVLRKPASNEAPEVNTRRERGPDGRPLYPEPPGGYRERDFVVIPLKEGEQPGVMVRVDRDSGTGVVLRNGGSKLERHPLNRLFQARRDDEPLPRKNELHLEKRLAIADKLVNEGKVPAVDRLRNDRLTPESLTGWQSAVPDLSGMAKYIVMIRGKDDDERLPRGNYSTTEWKSQNAKTPDEWATHLAQVIGDAGAPITFNQALLLASGGKLTADIAGGKNPEKGLWIAVGNGALQWQQGYADGATRFRAKPVEPADSPISKAVKQAAADYGTKNTVFTKDRADAALKRLLEEQSKRSAGIDPQLMMALFDRVGYHVEAGARAIGDVINALRQDGFGDWIVPYVRGAYNNVRDYPGFDNAGMSSTTEVERWFEESGNVSGSSASVERDREAGGAAGEPVGPASVPAGTEGAGAPAGEPVAADDEGGLSGPGYSLVPTDSAASAGASGNLSLFGGDGQIRGTRVSTGGARSGGGRSSRRPGVSADKLAADTAPPAARQSPLEAQRAADQISVAVADAANIDATLPNLLPAQRSDVLKAETRYLSSPKQPGFLLTNGTGTGKTFSGLGILKRWVRKNGNDALIVVPSQKVAADWVNTARDFFDLELHLLDGISDAGRGITITTYANFEQNNALFDRRFGFIGYDESHNLLQEKDGTTNQRTRKHWYMTLHPDMHYAAAYAREAPAYEQFKVPVYNRFTKKTVMELPIEKARELEAKAQALKAELLTRPRPKVLFLSATPFGYVKSIDYADTLLFDFEDGNRGDDGQVKRDSGGGYNSGSARDQFFMTHFGYRMRYNKLTRPDSDVDNAIMERRFNEHLKETGALSRTMLNIDKDYSREFFEYSSELGKQIDEGMLWVKGWERDADGNLKRREFTDESPALPDLAAYLDKQWDYHYLNALLEAMNAREAVKRVNQHLAMGRKAVVFHRYKTRHPGHPFRMALGDPAAMEQWAMQITKDPEGARDQQQIINVLGAQAEVFKRARPDLWNLDLNTLVTPTQLFKNTYGERAFLFNGDISAKERIANMAKFNTDGSGLDVAVVQIQAGKEGISMHDTTGAQQRALLSIGLPIQATDAIQMEGRIYRQGNQTNAVIEYLKANLLFEDRAFANAVARRSSTAENLAMGNDARDLMTAFVDGYNNPKAGGPHDKQGTGGKESDRARNDTSPWMMAKTFYFGQAKKTGQTKAAEGKDYFATPEPLGLKMVEWLNLAPKEKALEPSAGHGAIARFFPDHTRNTFVEPSPQLTGKLSLNARNGNVREMDFLKMPLVNKFHGIAMNPPFGVGGADAVKHLEHASKLLHNGGRIVAIIPKGPAADKRFDTWLYGKDDEGGAKGMYLAKSIDLPTVTFERAGTRVATRIVILDRADDPSYAPQHSHSELTGIEKIGELFDRLEHMNARPRPQIPEAEKELQLAKDETPAETKAEAAPTDTFVAHDQKHSKTGADQYLITPTKRLGPEWSAINARIKANGGYWSKFKMTMGDIRPGWVFKSKEDRDAFLTQLKGGEFQTAYHGSPSDHDRFSLNAIGTGEGAMAGGVQPQPMAEAAISAIVDPIVANVHASLGVTVKVMRWAKAPKWIRDMWDEAGRPPGRAPGGFHAQDGTIYIFSDRMYSKAYVEQVLTHELVGHAGVDAVVGSNWGRVMKRFKELATAAHHRDPRFMAIYGETMRRYPHFATDSIGFVREFIALASEHRYRQNKSNTPRAKLDRFMDMVRGFVVRGLRALGFRRPMGITEINNLLRQSDKILREGYPGAESQPADVEAFDTSDQTETPEFKRWFGDSKVVNRKGEPLVVYHGTATSTDFEKFRTPAYFTSDADAAQAFGDESAQDSDENTGAAFDSRLMPVYLSIKNPLELFDFGEFAEWNARKRTAAEKRGFDGVKIVMPDNGEQLWMAFRPEQIKSAIGNSGAFNPQDPRITFSAPEETGMFAIDPPPLRDETPVDDANAESLAFDDPESESRYQEARKGLADPRTMVERVRDFAGHVWAGFTRHHIDLPNTVPFALANDFLRQFEAAPGAAKESAIRILSNTVRDLSPREYELLSRKVLLDDLAYEVELGHDLPFALTPEAVTASKAKMDALVEKNPVLQQRFEYRAAVQQAMRDDLVEAGILSRESLKNPAYFRHQVLTYARARQMAQSAAGNIKTPKPGYAMHRKGSLEDINANYIEAEFEYLHRAMIDMKMVETIDKVRDHYDISGELRDAAKGAESGQEPLLDSPVQNEGAGSGERTDWRTLLPPGYVLWQPSKGNLFYSGKTVSERLLDQLMDQIEATPDMIGAKGIDEQTVRDLIASARDAVIMGGKKEQLAIPEELAATLDKMRPDIDHGLFDAVLATPLKWWKQWILINPRRVVKYNLNNLSGDLDAIIAGNPSIVRSLPRAISELFRIQYRGAEPSDRYREAVERGVFDAGLTVQEIPDINLLDPFSHLMEKPHPLRTPVKFTKHALYGVWKGLRDFTRFRENWLRYAAYLDYADRLEAGREFQYGASNPQMVDELLSVSTTDAAALLARDLVGDYGNVSHFGQGIRKYMIPFYSWMEVNTGRYVRLIKNAYGQGLSQGIATGTAIGVLTGARMTAWLGIRMTLMYVIVQLWNHLVHGDDEEKLSDADRVRLHILLGHDEDGTIHSLKFQGALSDFLQWFGFQDAVAAASSIEKGRADWGDVVEAVLKGAPNKIISGTTPLLQEAVALLFGAKLFPDVFNPTPIRDQVRNAAQLVSLENEYDALMDKPSRGYLRSWTSAVEYKQDAGELAYNKIRGLAYEWASEQRGTTGRSTIETPRSRAMYEYKLALRFGDTDAATAARARLRELKVDSQSMRQSIRLAAPLAPVAKRDRRKFRATLSARELEALDAAEKWYRQTYYALPRSLPRAPAAGAAAAP